MDSDSDQESIEGEVTVKPSGADWGKAKFDYYYTDYVDQDYPSKLSSKEERSAAIEQEEALRLQKKLLSTLDYVDLTEVYEIESIQDELLDIIERHNHSVESCSQIKKRKKVSFEENSDGYGESDSEEDEGEIVEEREDQRQRRPINIAMKKNRGLTPYKKKEYRNPRVKHKLKYKKAMSKRRRLVKEAQPQLHRYSGETTGIKTSTVKSIKLSGFHN